MFLNVVWYLFYRWDHAASRGIGPVGENIIRAHMFQMLEQLDVSCVNDVGPEETHGWLEQPLPLTC